MGAGFLYGVLKCSGNSSGGCMIVDYTKNHFKRVNCLIYELFYLNKAIIKKFHCTISKVRIKIVFLCNPLNFLF